MIVEITGVPKDLADEGPLVVMLAVAEMVKKNLKGPPKLTFEIVEGGPQDLETLRNAGYDAKEVIEEVIDVG